MCDKYSLNPNNIYFVLVETKYSGNIGLSARAIKNFGFRNLILVNPLTRIDGDAFARAMHAKDVLTNAQIYKTLKEFQQKEHIDFLIGTTARVGGEKNPLRLAIPLNALREAIFPRESKIAILFGNEERGLKNEDLLRCDMIITIPTSSEYPSLSLSHAVAICAYELALSLRTFRELPFRPSTHLERKILVENLHKILDIIAESMPESKKRIYKGILRNLVRRAFLTGREVHSLIGFTRMILRRLSSSEN